MIEFIKNIFRSKKARILKRYGLPEKLHNEWFNGSLYSSRTLPPMFDKDKNYIEYKEGDTVPMVDVGKGCFAFYTITRRRSQMGDWLYDSDAWHFDLVFSHIEKRNVFNLPESEFIDATSLPNNPYAK